MSSIVRSSLDPNNPPVLTVAQCEQLAALAAQSDDEIDLSDAPELDEVFFSHALQHPQYRATYRPVKQQMTVRLDADVALWLRSQGRGYQTKMNAILRQAMLQTLKPNS